MKPKIAEHYRKPDQFNEGGVVEDISGKEVEILNGAQKYILEHCPQKVAFIKLSLQKKKGKTISFYDTYELNVSLGPGWYEYYTEGTQAWMKQLGDKISKKYPQITSISLSGWAGGEFSSETYMNDEALSKQANNPKYLRDKGLMKKGGGIDEYEDLFENPDRIPAPVTAILERYWEEHGDMMDYSDTQRMLGEIEKEGYTFDYYLDNQPYGLRPVGVELKQLKGYEEMKRGGKAPEMSATQKIGWAKIRKVMREFKKGTLKTRGKKGRKRKVKDRQQAIAIALSSAKTAMQDKGWKHREKK